MKKRKIIKFFCILIYMFTWSISGFSETQDIKINVIPSGDINIYQVSSETTNREVIDLGHFNSGFLNGKIEIAKIVVEVKMLPNTSDSEKNEFEVVNLKNIYSLQLTNEYDIINFIGKLNGNLELKIENVRDIKTIPENVNTDTTLKFSSTVSDNNRSISYLSYSFNLVANVSGLSDGVMNGYSPKTSETTSEKAYINLKDIITAQIRGNTGM